MDASPVTVGVIVALLVGLFTLIFYLSKRKTGALRKNVLLVGVCDAGKTALYTKLVYGVLKMTQTSMKENVGTAIVDKLQGKASVSLIDLPGHERVRYHLLEKYRTSARAIAFVVDSATVQKDIKDVAEYLYNILVDEVFSKTRPALAVVCNKQDLTLAKGVTVIKSLLEKELNNLRVTQAAALSGTDGADGAESQRRLLPVSAAAAKLSGDFQFSHLAPWKITFCECSAKLKDADPADVSTSDSASSSSMTELNQWLGSLA